MLDGSLESAGKIHSNMNFAKFPIVYHLFSGTVF